MPYRSVPLKTSAPTAPNQGFTVPDALRIDSLATYSAPTLDYRTISEVMRREEAD